MFKLHIDEYDKTFVFNNIDELVDFVDKDIGFRMLSRHVRDLFENAKFGYKKDFSALGMSIECTKDDNTRLNLDDFNVVLSDYNGRFVRIEEINKMIECGAIIIDKEKLEQYKRNTRLLKINK